MKEGEEKRDGYEREREKLEALMRYGWMYSGWSPFLRVRFWKKEFVGRGDEREGEKKVEGSGRTVDWVWGKVKG